MENKQYCVYMHTNQINNKKYIGQTCQKPEYRWGDIGQGYIQCPIFYRAIQKYGWNNFEHEILKNNLTLEEANYWEEYYIKLYNTTDREYGYNLLKGGENREVAKETSEKISARLKEEWANGTRDREAQSQKMKEKWQDPEYREKQLEQIRTIPRYFSEESRKKISEARKAYIAEHGTSTQGKHLSEETKEKIRQSKIGEKNPMYGTHHTEEWKQNMSKKMSKKIKCVETGEIFNSYREAANWCGCKSTSGISDYLAGRKKSYGKHPETKQPLHWEKVI